MKRGRLMVMALMAGSLAIALALPSPVAARTFAVACHGYVRKDTLTGAGLALCHATDDECPSTGVATWTTGTTGSGSGFTSTNLDGTVFDTAFTSTVTSLGNGEFKAQWVSSFIPGSTTTITYKGFFDVEGNPHMHLTSAKTTGANAGTTAGTSVCDAD